jgi:hypothetical protein
MARVTGIGGVFLKARDPKALSAWYAQHLGIQLADYGGASLLWSDEVPAGTGQTTWMLFPDTTKHFGLTTASTTSQPYSPNSEPPTFPSIPTSNPIPTATSPGSLIPKATASNSGNQSSIIRKRGTCTTLARLSAIRPELALIKWLLSESLCH